MEATDVTTSHDMPRLHAETSDGRLFCYVNTASGYTLLPNMSGAARVCTHDNVTSTDGLDIMHHPQYWTSEVWQRIVTLAVIMTFTLLGNVIIISVLTCSRYRKITSRVNIFIVNLAIADLTVLVFTMTTEILFVVFEHRWLLGGALCKLLLYLQIVTLAATTFMLTAMSYDRYLALCQPMRIKGSFKQHALRLIAASWLLALLLATPQLFIFQQVRVGIYPDGEVIYACASRGYTAWWQRKLYFSFLACYILVLPSAIISYCYLNVVRAVWRHDRRIVADKDGNSLRRERSSKAAIPKAKVRTIKMTLCIICAFIMCWTPYFAVHLLHIWSEYTYKMAERVYVLVETVALLNSAINPVLYGFFNIKIKLGLMELCCPGRVRQRRSARAHVINSEHNNTTERPSSVRSRHRVDTEVTATELRCCGIVSKKERYVMRETSGKGRYSKMSCKKTSEMSDVCDDSEHSYVIAVKFVKGQGFTGVVKKTKLATPKTIGNKKTILDG